MPEPNDNDASPRPARPATLEEWFATPQGAYVLDWELARVDQVVADIFGYFAVQVGLPGIDFLRASRVTTRRSAALGPGAQVVADAHELPFASESLDLVVLPHLLEFSDEPHQILREIERVLRPEGQLVVLAFNPVSLWGVKKLFTRARCPPWSAEFVSVLRMKDWLKLLNFEMRGGRFGCYRPPFESEPWLARLGFLEHAGDRWWPVAGAVYLMQAKKRVAGMRLITPSWRQSRLRTRPWHPRSTAPATAPAAMAPMAMAPMAMAPMAMAPMAMAPMAMAPTAIVPTAMAPQGTGANWPARARAPPGITHQSPWKEPQHD